MQKDLQSEEGAVYHLCRNPEESLSTMLNLGFTADCFTLKSLQEFFGCVVECVGKGITERRGIASEFSRYNVTPKNLAKIQGWLTGSTPEPQIQLELAVKNLIEVSSYNQLEELSTSFLKKTKPRQVRRNLPGYIDLLLHITSSITANDALPSAILEQEGLSGYVSSGYSQLDELLRPPDYQGRGGLGLGQLTVLGMPSNHGKSTFSCNLAANFIRQQMGVIFFSMEMGSKRMLLWLMSNLANMPMSAIETPSGEYEQEAYIATKELADDWLRMYSGHQKISSMSALIKAHQRQFGPIGLVIIDRFRNILDEDEWGRRTGWDLLDAKANALLQMAQETEAHIFTLNQMTDYAKSNWEKNMSVKADKLLRGGQSLYNAADVVLAGGRHIGHDENIYDPSKENVTRLWVKKVRDAGPDRGMFELKFNPMYHRLEEI